MKPCAEAGVVAQCRARRQQQRRKRSARTARGGGQATRDDGARGCAAERGRQPLEGGDNGHYPSSWYNKAKKPVRPPTHTGSHAAAIGCINSALLKSSVTFDKT